MSIQIIDGFQVNIALPIDNRIVASGSAARDAISYKYEGLRVFDTSNSIPYVWINGTWSSENASGVVGSGTTTNYIPKFTGTNIVGNSTIYQSGSNIGVNTTSPSTLPGETTTFHVNGGIIANKFQGNGSLITNISGSNINSGSINVSGASSSIIQGSSGQVLLSGTSFTSWTNQSQLSVGTASSSLNSNITRVSTGSTHYLTFVSSGAWAGLGSGNEVIKSNHLDLTYSPSLKTLYTGTVSVTSVVTEGIKFPTTQVSSPDLNTLDDYEEGTWTPVISGVTTGFTYTSSGFYTKIGKVVFVGGYIKYTSPSPYSAIGSDNNYISIGNIPYQAGMPVSSANVGQWSRNTGSGTIAARFFNTGGPYAMDDGPVVASYQASGNPNIYFSSNSGVNPLASGPQNQVISFSLTFIPL